VQSPAQLLGDLATVQLGGGREVRFCLSLHWQLLRVRELAGTYLNSAYASDGIDGQWYVRRPALQRCSVRGYPPCSLSEWHQQPC
jgi:hypothetical protein